MSDTSNTSTENDAVFTDPDIADERTTNDAVAGETVIDTGHYAGPDGSEPLEATPYGEENELEDEPIDLDGGE